MEILARYNNWYEGTKDKKIIIDPAKTAFVLVDVYNNVANNEKAASLWNKKWETVVNNYISPSLKAARLANLPVIYVMNSAPRINYSKSEFANVLKQSLSFDPSIDFSEDKVDDLEYNKGPVRQLSIPENISPISKDYYIRKHTYDGFFQTRLDSLLRNLNIRTIFFVGFVANCCLLFTMASALFRNYECIMLRDCTLASELPEDVNELNQTKLMVLWIETILGYTINSHQFIEYCEETQKSRGDDNKYEIPE
jgi:nicotinamidase-related amidase